MITLKFWTQIDPTKTLPTDDASQAHLVALAADVVRGLPIRNAHGRIVNWNVSGQVAARDEVEIEVDAMFAEVASW